MNIERILEHLGELVACDSQNPPRAITADSTMFPYIRDVLADRFDVDVVDHGSGHVALLAVRGAPELLFNCHLDTVPIGDGWRVPPLGLTVRDGKAWGRGTCDIKGAAAALLAVAESSDAPLALLFTSDEEAAGACCVRRFLESDASAGFKRAVVSEPTGNRAVLSHRGFLSVLGRFNGTAGHSSELRALDDNAVHAAARWMAAADAHCREQAAAGRPTCFNAGTISGGIAANVIADDCSVHYSARLAPGEDNEAFLDAVSGLGDAGARAEWNVLFAGPPLPSAGRDTDAARAFAGRCGLEITERVDFWTEAALFSDAGLDALVLGPGDIRQAHTVDEWVELDQLEIAAAQYRRIAEGAS